MNDLRMTFWRTGRTLPTPTKPTKQSWWKRLFSKPVPVKKPIGLRFGFAATFIDLRRDFGSVNLVATDIYDVLAQLQKNPNVLKVVEVRTQWIPYNPLGIAQ